MNNNTDIKKMNIVADSLIKRTAIGIGNMFKDALCIIALPFDIAFTMNKFERASKRNMRKALKRGDMELYKIWKDEYESDRMYRKG